MRGNLPVRFGKGPLEKDCLQQTTRKDLWQVGRGNNTSLAAYFIDMAKRKYGEGSVFQRKDGRYVAQVKLDGGKKKQRYFKSEKEARIALRKMLHEKEQGTLATGPQQTLKVYLDQWLEQVHKPAIRTSTYYMYRTVSRSTPQRSKHFVKHGGES